jgi:apolipoprotein N-acyltransferase
VVGSLLILLIFSRTHIWGEDDIEGLVGLAICGLVVVGAIVFVCRGREKRGGAIAGMLFGFVPSLVIFMWVWLAQPGFEGSAGGVALAVTLAVPSGIGGALAGLISSNRNERTL